MLPLRPLVDLLADEAVAPAMLAAAALQWSTVDSPLGWSASRAVSPELRALLTQAGGPDTLAAMSLPDPVRDRLDSAGEHEPGELLWAARLALALGFADEATSLLRRIPATAPEAVLAWKLVLAAQGDRVPAGDLPPGAPDAARLHAHWLAASLWPEGSPEAAAELVEAARITSGLNARLAALATARTLALRLKASNDDDIARVRAELAAARDGADPALAFLLDDAELSLVLAAGPRAAESGNQAAADEYARAAVAIDPNGAPAHLLAAEVALHARPERARQHFRSAARLGLIERDAALAGLLHLASDPDRFGDDMALVGVAADLLTLSFTGGPARLEALTARRAALSMTPVHDTVRWADAALRRPAAASLPLPLQRYRPFLDLRAPEGLDPSDVPPVVIHTPLLSYAAVLDAPQPWFREAHPQRATAAMFRTELARGAAMLGYGGAGTSDSYEEWLAAPDGCPAELRERLAGAADATVLERAMLGRLLSGLGFHEQTQRLLPGPEHPVRTPEDAYSLSTWLFAEQMLRASSRADLNPMFRVLYGQLGTDIRFRRIRLGVCINAAVASAHRKEIATLAFWRAEGAEALADYVALDEVHDFYKQLMTSRYYRAMSFLPYLTGDHDQLRSDMDRWHGTAADLAGHDEHTRILAADNYFPAVETMVRTHTHLGEHDAALALVNKLAAEIDPLDPKTWLEAGELRYRAGDVTGALDAYLRAAHLQIPYGRLSWFNAGQCHEQLGQRDEAVECYRRSLAHWPTGVTPLRRLRDLLRGDATIADDGLLHAWCTRQPAWSSLPA